MNTAQYVDQDHSADIDSTWQTQCAEYLTRYFCRECGFRPLPWMPRKFKELLQKGYDQKGIEELIELTAMAPRPSWAYLAAIVRNEDQMVDNLIQMNDFYKARSKRSVVK